MAEIGERVVVRDSTGCSTEGILRGDRSERGIDYVVLTTSRQINFQDVTTVPPTVEAWDIPGENLIARHLIVGIHPTHLGAR